METLAHPSNRRIHPPSRSAPCGLGNHWHARQLQRLDGEGKSQEDIQRLCPSGGSPHQWAGARISSELS